MDLARKLPSYDDIVALPSNVVGEIIAGELVVSPRPGPVHARFASGLGVFIGGPYQYGLGGPGGWWIIDEPELHLQVEPAFLAVVPDLAGWRRERMPAMPETAYFTVVPDWVCEVLSPGTRPYDRAEKLPYYGRAGVRHAWLVDPIAQLLEVFANADGEWRLLNVWRGDAVVRAAPFDAIQLDLGVLWSGGAGEVR